MPRKQKVAAASKPPHDEHMSAEAQFIVERIAELKERLKQATGRERKRELLLKHVKARGLTRADLVAVSQMLPLTRVQRKRGK